MPRSPLVESSPKLRGPVAVASLVLAESGVVVEPTVIDTAIVIIVGPVYQGSYLCVSVPKEAFLVWWLWEPLLAW